jgi:hypothetical protein
MRRSLLGSETTAFPTLLAYSNGDLFAILALLTGGFGVLAFGAFRFFDRLAREKGMIDAQSNF